MIQPRAQEQLRALLEHQEGTRIGRDPEELHQFRVAIRRLRSLLKGAPAADENGELRAELKWLGSLTGPVRDIDVLLLRLEEDAEDFAPDDQRAARALVAALRADRGRRRGQLNRALGSKRYTELLGAVAALATPGDAADEEEPETAPKAGAVRKPYRKLAKAVDKLGDDPPDDELHALRIRGKRLRYAAETARHAAGNKQDKKLAALVKACKKFQNVLGDHQDAVVAAARVRELAAAQDDVTVALVAGRLVEREQAKRAAARAAWPEAWQRVSGAAAPLC